MPAAKDISPDCCAAPAPGEELDLVVAAWFLVFAHDRAELTRMCDGLASRLRPGGRFVTIAGTPVVQDYRPTPDYRKYGFTVELTEPTGEGAPIVWTIDLDDISFEIVDYDLPMDACIGALRASGFRDHPVYPIELSSHPDGLDDRAYWADLLNHPQAILMDCLKEQSSIRWRPGAEARCQTDRSRI